MTPRNVLRFEGLAVAGAALAAYFHLDGPLWLLAVLALAPDLSMVGYLGGTHVGATIYNAFHTYVFPVALGAGGLLLEHRFAILVALVWAGHIGADRFFGYGLKYPTGFKDTHLGTYQQPAGDLVESE